MFAVFMVLGWAATTVLITLVWRKQRPGRSIVPGLLLGLVSGLLWPVTMWIAIGMLWHQRSRSSSRLSPMAHQGGIVLACIVGSLATLVALGAVAPAQPAKPSAAIESAKPATPISTTTAPTSTTIVAASPVAAPPIVVASPAGPPAASVPSAPAPPPYAGKIGIPVHATAPNGATADITLNDVRMKPENCVGSFGCIVLDLTFTGTSAVAFPYSESFVTWDYGGGPDPFNHPNNSNETGADPTANYVPFMPPAPLRVGEVVNGLTKRGLVIADFNGGHHVPFVLTVSDPSTVAKETQWLLISP